MKKILIVDDDRDTRNAIESVLSRNYSLKQAGGKDEAKKLFSTYLPDLVVLDVMMDTDSTGFELAREFKQSANPPKILMLTAIDTELSIDFKSEAGNPDWLPVDAYLTKPLTPNVLMEKVQSLLP